MKFRVTMKDPDTLEDAVREAAKKSLSDIQGIDDEERESLIDQRVESNMKICKKWFEYGEYLTVEVDTDAGTCTVLTK